MGNANSRRNQRPGGGAANTNNTNNNNRRGNGRPQQTQPGNQPYYLMFGGPPVHYRYNPGGPMIFYVDRQQSTAPPPEVSESDTIRNLANLHKSSLSLEPHHDAPTKYFVTFTADTLTPTDVTLYFAATEKPDPNTPGSGGAMFVPMNVQLPNHVVHGGKLGVGSLMKFRSHAAFDVEMYGQYLAHSETAPADYPLVVQLTYEVSKEQGESSGAEEKGKEKEGTVQRSLRRQYTYAQIVASTSDTGEKIYKIRPIRQRLQVDGSLFEVEDIYGMEGAGQPAEGQPVTGTVEQVEVEGEECVICLAEERDTIVMPCRHLCLCGDCAEVLRKQTNKCPICRTVIERLITKKIEK